MSTSSFSSNSSFGANLIPRKVLQKLPSYMDSRQPSFFPSGAVLLFTSILPLDSRSQRLQKQDSARRKDASGGRRYIPLQPPR